MLNSAVRCLNSALGNARNSLRLSLMRKYIIVNKACSEHFLLTSGFGSQFNRKRQVNWYLYATFLFPHCLMSLSAFYPSHTHTEMDATGAIWSSVPCPSTHEDRRNWTFQPPISQIFLCFHCLIQVYVNDYPHKKVPYNENEIKEDK